MQTFAWGLPPAAECGAEATQQRCAYRELVCSLPMGRVVNTDRPLEMLWPRCARSFCTMSPTVLSAATARGRIPSVSISQTTNANMPVQAAPGKPDGFVLRLALFYAAFMGVMGIQIPFFPLWLEAKSLDARAIGIVLAATVLARIFAVPLIGRAVDRTGNTRDALIAASFASVFCYGLVGVAGGFAAILLTVALSAIAFMPINTLADAYAIKGLAPHARPYGSVRLWGSIAFLITNLAAGALLSVIDAVHLIWLIVVATVAACVCALRLPAISAAPAEKPRSWHATHRFWHSPRFVVVAVAASLIQASHAVYYGFSAIDWTTKGFSNTAVGTLWAIGVGAEIVLFAIYGRLKLSSLGLIGAGGAGALLRWIVMSFDPAGWLLLIVQCLHAFSFGATHLGSVLFASEAAGSSESATAQADFGTVLAVGAAIATACSGFVYGAFGDGAYLVMAAISLVGASLLAVGRRLRH